MDRFSTRRSLSFLLATAGVGMLALPTLGCKGPLSTAFYLIGGNDRPAEYAGLKRCRTVVVVRANSASADEEHGARELAVELGNDLTRNVSGIKIVPQKDVDRWKDENNGDREDFRALGKTVKADKVLVVELESFRLNDNSTSMYTGRCDYRVVVHDMSSPEGSPPAFEKTPTNDTVYPPNHGIPIGEKSRASFRRQFVSVVAGDIGRLFYPHDATTYFARDSEALDSRGQ